MRPGSVVDCWRRPLLTGPIDSDYQDGRAFEFDGPKNWSSLVKGVLAAARVSAVTDS
jgi:hypothetical protein